MTHLDAKRMGELLRFLGVPDEMKVTEFVLTCKRGEAAMLELVCFARAAGEPLQEKAFSLQPLDGAASL